MQRPLWPLGLCAHGQKEETDAAAEEELLEAMAEEELVAEEDEVLRMFL